MAENRTFQFLGQGYGSSDATIVAKINNTTVYSGPVPTVDEPILPPPQILPSNQALLFEIANSSALNTDFAGSLPMSIEVTNGTGVLFNIINCNYYKGDWYSDPNAGQPNAYNTCYTGTPTNSEQTIDVRSSVYIDGVQQVPPLPTSLGCWTWIIPGGSTMTYNWNISVGQVGNVQGNVSSYSGPYTATP